mmetsp:Transcript_9727/g.23928  ORF Transcript_9727/g.23928 Transcript_9727/m.23928 type:complete len:203 (+) Transcript_9727:977-1585(+)
MTFCILVPGCVISDSRCNVPGIPTRFESRAISFDSKSWRNKLRSPDVIRPLAMNTRRVLPRLSEKIASPRWPSWRNISLRLVSRNFCSLQTRCRAMTRARGSFWNNLSISTRNPSPTEGGGPSLLLLSWMIRMPLRLPVPFSPPSIASSPKSACVQPAVIGSPGAFALAFASTISESPMTNGVSLLSRVTRARRLDTGHRSV